MDPYFRSSVIRLGGEASGLVAGGVMILFREPVPEELADVSVIHAPASTPGLPVSTGDELMIGNSRVTLTAVGERADANLRELGHIVVYLNPGPDSELLPGAVHARGELAMPEPGAGIELRRRGSGVSGVPDMQRSHEWLTGSA